MLEVPVNSSFRNAAAALIALAAGAPALAQPGRYRWEEVPTFLNSGVRGGFALNNAGRVVGFQSGQIITNPPVISYIAAGFSWDTGDLRKMLGAGSGLATTALAISGSGIVVGYGAPQAGQTRAAILSDIAAPVFLPTLGGTSSAARAVNDSGVVAGSASTSGGSTHACRWDAAGTPLDLGTLGGTQSNAQAINAAGSIVGTSTIASGINHAFIVPAGGPMTDLNSFLAQGSPWVFTSGVDVNTSGRVAGNGTLSGDARGFTFDPANPAVVRELTPLPGQQKSSVLGMNNQGWAAGTSTIVVGRFESFRAVVWKDGGAIDISARVVNRIVDYYDSAADINDAGQVLVIGPPAGASHGMNSIHRLTPLCDADFNADGFMNGSDFDEFITAFEAGDSAADYNEDTFVNGSDFDEFIVAFVDATGCP